MIPRAAFAKFKAAAHVLVVSVAHISKFDALLGCSVFAETQLSVITCNENIRYAKI